MKNIIKNLVMCAIMCIILYGTIQLNTIHKQCEKTNATLTQELLDEKQDHLRHEIKCLENITYLINNILPPKEKELDIGVVIVQLSMGSLEEMKKEEVALRQYVTELNKYATAQFFIPGLEDRIKIIHEQNNYFLVMEKLTVPWAVGICNFMWNAREYPRWARDPNHTCREMI